MIDFKSADDESQYDYINKDREASLALKASLNLFESLSIAIQLGYVDEVVANRNLDFIIIYFHENFSSFVQAVRDKNDDQFIYDELEKLASSWKKKRYLYSGKKIIYNKERK
jgi:hypothetical protein